MRKLRLAVWMAGVGLSVLFATRAGGAGAQEKKVATDEGTIPAVFVSDIHFEPFFDPGKVERLAAAPLSAWKGILAAAPSVDRAASFAALERSVLRAGRTLVSAVGIELAGDSQGWGGSEVCDGERRSDFAFV